MAATASGATPEGPVGLDPFAPGFFDDPYVQYAALHKSMHSL